MINNITIKEVTVNKFDPIEISFIIDEEEDLIALTQAIGNTNSGVGRKLYDSLKEYYKAYKDNIKT